MLLKEEDLLNAIVWDYLSLSLIHPGIVGTLLGWFYSK